MSAREASPSPEQVLRAREAAGQTQEQAAATVHLSSFTRWSEYERGARTMDQARFELYQIKTGQHDVFGPLAKKRARAVAAQRERA